MPTTDQTLKVTQPDFEEPEFTADALALWELFSAKVVKRAEGAHWCQ